MLEKSKIDGGEVMQTLADRLRSEGEKIGKKIGKKIGEEIGEKRGERRGEKRGKIESARRMLMDGISIGNIVKYTGLKEKEIEKLAASVH
jgi:predicted transposase YdaD